MNFPIKKLLLLQGTLAGAAGLLRSQWKNPFSRIFPNFYSWPKFLRHFVQNLSIGICIEILVHISGHYWHLSFVVDTENAVLDSMMRLSADISLKNDKRPTQLFIDVDEQTYRDQVWGGGEPRALPLDKIADLIKGASSNSARYVLVDFAIDGRQDDQQENFVSRMEKILEEYPQSHFLFVRTLRQPLERSTVKAIRSSFALDTLIARHPDRIHSVAPNFLRSSDQVLRHWRLWESACYQLPGQRGKEGEGRWAVVPSPQLMIASLENGMEIPWALSLNQSQDGLMPNETLPCAVDVTGGDPVGVEQIREQGQSARMADFQAGTWVQKAFHTCYQQDSFTEDHCGEESSPPKKQLQKEIIVKVEGEYLANRILFRQSDWVKKHTEGIQRDEKPTMINYDQYFDRLPAINLLTSTLPKVGPAARALEKLKNGDKNKELTVAVIGASYEDSRDTHITPLGGMPGSLVLVNAIDTLQSVGILQYLPTFANFFITALILVGISAAFALLSAFWASALMLALVALTMGPLSFWFLKQGVWLNLGAPIIGIYLHREWEDLMERCNTSSPH
jgi:hypothetical protein